MLSELNNLLKPLILLGFAFAVMFRLMSPKKIPSKLMMWILGPIITAIFITQLKGCF